MEPASPGPAAELAGLRRENEVLRAALRHVLRTLEGVQAALPQPAGDTTPAEVKTEAPRQTDSATAARRRNTIKSRCFVRKLSDRKRREALDRAYAEGVLEPHFNELELPWRDAAYALDRHAHPTRVASVGEAAGALGDLSKTEYNFWLMARLARFGAAWGQWSETIHQAWEALQRRPGDADAPFRKFEMLSADSERASFPNGHNAVRGDDLLHPDSLGVVRRGGQWFAAEPPRGVTRCVYDEGEEPLEASQLYAMARRRNPKATALAWMRLKSQPATVRALALYEIAFGRR